MSAQLPAGASRSTLAGEGPRERIAIVGTGISGLVAGHLLAPHHDVTVYEARDRLGGHTHTVEVTLDGRTTAVDTGFIVFNLATYPNFVRLLQKLGVPWQSSDMSFSARSEASGLEYGSQAMFAQRRNLLRPRFWRLLADIVRFNREAPRLLEDGDDALSLGDYLRQGRYSDVFVNEHIVPLGAAVWSSPPERMLAFPARYFVRFFVNHQFLQLTGRTPWLVLRGGSRSYLQPLTAPFADRVLLGNAVTSVRRHPTHVEITSADGELRTFDRVILAAHADQSLRLLADPSPLEQEVLSAFSYQQNPTVLHTDTSVMPRNRAAWSSWNYLIPADGEGTVTATYWMNRLQSLPGPQEFLVSLNLSHRIDPSKILGRFNYSHPVYTPAAVAAQGRHAEIDGAQRTHFCGAYWGFGFHEDGVNSALRVCAKLGQTL